MNSKYEEELIQIIKSDYIDYDAIVVEGYDGVGKGRVLSILSELFDIEPYRPDYNMWQNHDHRYKDRWKVSAFFWDIYSHFKLKTEVPMLFDRGVLSGAVYNNDMQIARDYPKMIRDRKIIHIIIQCEKEDYVKFYLERNDKGSISGAELMYSKYLEFTERFKRALEESGVEYIFYTNRYNNEFADSVKGTCGDCRHYSYGWCRHPNMNKRVDIKDIKCELADDMEVQDAAEMSELRASGMRISTNFDSR